MGFPHAKLVEKSEAIDASPFYGNHLANYWSGKMADPSWTSTEWTALGSVLSGAGTVIGALAVIGAAWFGSRTFESWRKQTLSQRRIEQAERILTTTYKVRRGLSFARNPMLWAHELQAAEHYLKEKGQFTGDDRGKKKLATAQVYYSRMNGELDNRRALEGCQPMARALFGEPLELAMENLNRQFQIVNASVQAQYGFEEDTDKEFRKKVQATLWGGTPTPEENEMDQTIAELVRVIEKVCVPVLRLEK